MHVAMYISAPAGIKLLARHLIPEKEFKKLEDLDFNVYGDQKSMPILQFMRDLDWIYISYDEGDRISLKPTKLGIDIFENGLTKDYMKNNEKIIELIRGYLENYLAGKEGLSEETYILADYFLKAGNFNRAVDLGSSLIDMGTKNKDAKLLGRAHQIYGSINLYRMDIEFARNHFERSIRYAEEADDILTSAKAHLGLGSYFGYKGDPESSMQYFEKALLLFEEVGDETGMNQVKMNEAFTLAKKGNMKEFFTLNHEAMKFFISRSDDHHLQYCYQNESSVLLAMGEYDAAIESVIEANHLAMKTGNERVQHLSGLNIAMIYIYTKRPGDAYEYIEKAFEYFRRNFDTNGLGLVYQTYMSYDLATKDLGAAEKDIDKMIQNFKVKKQNSLIAEAFSVYIKLLTLYNYPEKVLNNKMAYIKSLTKKLEIEEEVDKFIKIRSN
jgi:tetratricopeptide (TPR) repeat protein